MTDSPYRVSDVLLKNLLDKAKRGSNYFRFWMMCIQISLPGMVFTFLIPCTVFCLAHSTLTAYTPLTFETFALIGASWVIYGLLSLRFTVSNSRIYFSFLSLQLMFQISVLSLFIALFCTFLEHPHSFWNRGAVANPMKGMAACIAVLIAWTCVNISEVFLFRRIMSLSNRARNE